MRLLPIVVVGIGLLNPGVTCRSTSDALENEAPLILAASASANKSTTKKTKVFGNYSRGLNAKLRENYVDFHFHYPAGWTLDREGARADEPNFVKVERKADAQSNLTLENFAIGYFRGTGSQTGDMALAPALMKQLEASFSKFPNYKKLSEGKRRFNSRYQGYELRFKSQVKVEEGMLTIWGRTFILPPTKPGAKQGVTIIMLATSAAPELKSMNDVGVKGQLPVIINSFRFGEDGDEGQ